MFKKLILLICLAQLLSIYPQAKTIHVFVSLCDNQFQGIVPVPKKMGNGKDPSNNLYWGAAYGVKSYFHRIAKDWKLVKKINSSNDDILERVLFKHKYKNIFLLADAYDGEQIKSCTRNFLKASNNQNSKIVTYKKQELSFGGDANLLAYVGHDGLMDFSLNIDYQENIKKEKDVIILACYSQYFFSPEIKKAKANPILWTTHLMAPEAYILEATINSWINSKLLPEIRENAAQAYHKYQKCGLRGARNLFTYGFK